MIEKIIEILIKILITFVGIIIFGFFLKGVWKGQLDIRETLSRLIHKVIPEPDFIAKRDPNKIYQNGKEVGIVSGNVVDNDDSITFAELSETESLNKNDLFEYKRYKLKIVKIESLSGFNITANNTGTKTQKSVLTNVVCKKFK